MPCNQVRMTSVDLKIGNKNPKLLKAALESLGYSVSFMTSGGLRFWGINKETGAYHNGTYSDGELTSNQQQYAAPLDVDSVKVAYSHAAVHEKARKYGWSLTKTKNGYIAKKG